MQSHGKAAERFVIERIRAALPADAFHLYPNAEWLGSMREGGPPRDGEADLVIVHAEHGILVLEVKSGVPSRDHAGRWWIGDRALDRDPFTQAKDSKHQLVRKLAEMADWPPRTEPRAGHAIALPDVDLASLPRGHVLLGADAPRELVLDAEALETPESIRCWVERAYAYWLGDGSRGAPLGALGVRLVDELLAPTWTLHRLVRGHIEDDRADLLAASREQARIVSRTRTLRRLEVVGPAGSGKSMLAAEKARRLAREGYRTLLVCFNQRLATSLIRELEDAPAPAGLDVTTFHRLCERLGAEAGVLPARPEPESRAAGGTRRSRARSETAIVALPDRRYHAVVVDEGQDFEARWFELLQRLLVDPGDVFWVFHDPGQALIRGDVVAGLGLERHELFENHRNPESIAALAGRFYRGGEEVSALRETGRRHTRDHGRAGRRDARGAPQDAPPAHRGRAGAALEDRRALGTCPRPRAGSGAGAASGTPSCAIRPCGTTAARRAWRPRTVPDEPDEVLFETIRRFKGMEREVVVLVELPVTGDRLDELLYVGLTRATTELVVIAPPELARRLA